jgi:hypothetical protein
MTYKWFVDISHYQTLTDAQVSELVANGMVGMAIKGGQGISFEDNMAQEHTDMCKRLNVPFIIYHWADPILPPAPQARFAIELAKKFGARGICPDIEQYWKSWEEWYKVVIQHQPGIVRTFPPEVLTRFYTDYLRELNTINRVETKLPIMTYSAKWFIDAYCRALAPVIRDLSDDYWNAAYQKWHQLDQDVKVSWDEFYSTIGDIVLPSTMIPNGIGKWSAWQFAILPMRGWPALDCDVITEEASAKYFGTEPIIPPPPPPPAEPTTFQMKVICDALNIRSGPGGNFKDLGDLKKGDTLNVVNVFGSPLWIEFEPGKFCCVKNADGTYMEKYVKPLV